VSIATLLPERAGRSSAATSSVFSSIESSLLEVVRKVFLAPEAIDYQVVALISPGLSDGVSFLCACLASVLGESNGKTLVISGVDLLNMGIANLQLRDVDFMKVGDNEVWVVPQELSRSSCRTSMNVSLLNSLTNLKRQFDFIIVDAGAFGQRGLPQELSSWVDGFLLVVTEGQTEISRIANIRKDLTKNGGRIIGAIYSSYSSGTAGGR